MTTPLFLVLSLFVGPVIAGVVVFFLEPILHHVRSAISRFATPITGALSALEEALKRSELVVRKRLIESGRSLIRDGDESATNWPWRKIMKPLLALATFAYLALIELYLAALAFGALFGSGQVPNLHLNLPLLMGSLWPGVAIAWAEALTDAIGAAPREPYASLSPRVRKVAVIIISAGLASAFIGNIAFFVWRQGQLGTTNPFGGLMWVIVALLGALMFGGLALSAASGLPILAGLIPLVLAPIDLILILAAGAAAGARLGVVLTAEAAELVLESLLGIAGQLKRVRRRGTRSMRQALEGRAVLRAQVAADHARRNALREEERAAERAATRAARAAREAARLPEHGLPHQLGLAVVDGNRAFWQIVTTTLAAIGKSLNAIASYVATLIGSLLAAAGAAVVLAAKVVAAIALWAFYLLPRIRFVLWNWLCRFDFLKNQLHFIPLGDPPPKTRLDAHIAHLDLPITARGAEVRPLRPTPSPATGSADGGVDRAARAEPPAGAAAS